MSIKLGNNSIENINLGNTKINKIYHGEDVVYKVNMLSYIEFTSPNDFSMSISTKNWDGIVEYSRDNVIWYEWDGSEISSTAENHVYMRGTGNTFINSQFVLTGTDIRCSGNIESLLDYETVANGEHPAMGKYCFARMFQGCSSLTTAPELPSPIVTEFCYLSMFSECSNLLEAPELPATNLEPYCYNKMFNGCTSLIRAPSSLNGVLFEGQTAPSYAYFQMFYNCSSLTKAPSIAYRGTVGLNSMRNMFRGCSSLTTVPKLYFDNTTSANDIVRMFDDCTSLYVSDTQTAETPYEWRFPAEGVFNKTMNTVIFYGCLGTRSSDALPMVSGESCVFYTQNPPV